MLTERSLNDQYFQDREAVSDNEPTAPSCLRHPLRKIKDLNSHVSANVHFLCTILLPLMGHSVSESWKTFSLQDSVIRLFPGFGVLRCLLQAGINKLIPSKRTEDKGIDEYPTPKIVGHNWLNDLFVGFSVGAMSVPQGMSYAMLAGLAIEYGLYNNIIFPLVYFVFGSSRHAMTGVSAVENLMAGETITDLVGQDASPAERHNVAVLLCMSMSVIYLLFRFLRLAVIADLLADPVLSGFATASAFLVGTSQLKYAFGFSEIKADWGLPQSWAYILAHLDSVKFAPLICCLLSLAFLILCKKISRALKLRLPIPGPLLLVIFSCLISWLADTQKIYGIKSVGHIPSGLPTFFLPTVSWSVTNATPASPYIWTVVLHTIKLAILFFVIHISIVKTIAMRQKYELDVPQEFIAFAAMNAIGSFFGCYPANTSLSRSSVTEQLGAKTHLHSLAAGSVVLCTMLFLTRPLSHLPMPSLAAVVLSGVSNMVDFKELAQLWRLQKASWASAQGLGGGSSSPDLLLWITAFTFTLFLDATIGILVSVAVSLLWIGRSIVRPDFIELGQLPGTSIWRNCKRFPEARVRSDVLVCRFDAPLNFCNSKYLERCVTKLLTERYPRSHHAPSASSSAFSDSSLERESLVSDLAGMPPYFFILDCSSVNALDITAISSLRRITEHANQHRVTIAFSNWKGPQRDFLAQADFYDVVPPQRCFLSNVDAVTWAISYKQRSLEAVTPEADAIELSMPQIEWTGLKCLKPESSKRVREVQGSTSRLWDVDTGV